MHKFKKLYVKQLILLSHGSLRVILLNASVSVKKCVKLSSQFCLLNLQIFFFQIRSLGITINQTFIVISWFCLTKKICVCLLLLFKFMALSAEQEVYNLPSGWFFKCTLTSFIITCLSIPAGGGGSIKFNIRRRWSL